LIGGRLLQKQIARPFSVGKAFVGRGVNEDWPCGTLGGKEARCREYFMYGILHTRVDYVCELAWSEMGGGQDVDRMCCFRRRFRSAKDRELTFSPRMVIEQMHWTTSS